MFHVKGGIYKYCRYTKLCAILLGSCDGEGSENEMIEQEDDENDRGEMLKVLNFSEKSNLKRQLDALIK
jgi:hypothetical protein